jgi:Tfp pilus assembly protein PilF
MTETYTTTERTEMLTHHLQYAATWLQRGSFNSALWDLKLALTHANKLKRRDLKSLIFRAMNHIRSAQRIAS